MTHCSGVALMWGHLKNVTDELPFTLCGSHSGVYPSITHLTMQGM